MAVNNNYPDVPHNFNRMFGGQFRVLITVISNILKGKQNNCGEVTLTINAATTTVKEPLCNANSVILLTPTTANAGTEAGAGSLYVVAGDATFVIHHVNAATAGRTFRYTVVG